MALRSVLIVDDSEIDRYILSRQIREAGITEKIFEAENGRAAIEFFENYAEQNKNHPGKLPPCVIFLDINMPILNGFEFLEEYKVLLSQRPELESVVLMMFSSSELAKEKEVALAYDFVKGYITKMPDSGESLKKTLSTYFPELASS